MCAAMQIDRLDAEGKLDSAKVWREVLKRLDRLEEGTCRRQ